MATSLLERAKMIARHCGMSLAQWQESLGLSNSHFYNCQGLTRKLANVIEEKYPEVSTEWLASGKGTMIVGQKKIDTLEGYLVPVLPTAALGSSRLTFEMLVSEFDCEMVISPIKNVTLVITNNGDSMSPEYPNGCKLYVQRINEDAFIEWGSSYALDTVNGPIVKNVFQNGEDNESVICRSINPNFADFVVKRSDVRGWYKVRLSMVVK